MLSCGTSKVIGSGSVTLAATGTLKLGSLNGTSALGDNIVATLNALPTGSTIDYNGTAAQNESNQTFSNLIVSNNSGINLSSGNALIVKGNLTNNSSITGAGKVVMNGTSAQTINGVGNLSNLEIDNSSGVSISSDTVKLTGLLSVTSGMFTTNGRLVLKSNSGATAIVGPVNGSISGGVIAERYISKPSGALSTGRGWRLLNAPLKGSSGNTLFNNWQNGGSTTGVTGLEMWGPGGTGSSGNGLSYGPGASVKKYDAATNAWINVINTTSETLFDNTINKPFLVFCTGPYGSNNITSGADSTLLCSSGTLITGTQSYSFTPAGSNDFELTANPYACSIDFDKVHSNAGTSNIRKKFWTVDPNINEVGGYVLVQYNSITSSYDVIPSTSAQTQFIQSGQSFFVQDSVGGIATVAIEENDKETGASNNAADIFRTNGGVLETFRVSLKAAPSNATPVTIDEALVNCHQNYSGAVTDNEDGIKFLNFHESVAVLNGTTKLAIEGRPLYDGGDTLNILLPGLRQRSYQLELQAGNMAASGLSVSLFDSYLNTITPVSLNGATSYSFTVDYNPGSSSANRFFIVFASSAPLDLRFISVLATRITDHTAEVKWQTNGGEGVTSYEVERSFDGQHFNRQAIVEAGNESNYSWGDVDPEPGVNYYRIKAVGRGRVAVYSSIAAINMKHQNVSVSVCPNPVTEGQLQVAINGASTGDYDLAIYNLKSEAMMNEQISATGGIISYVIDLHSFTPGVYVLKLTDGTKAVIGERKIVVQ